MKTKVATLVLVCSLAGVFPAMASDEKPGPLAVAADAVVVRPLGAVSVAAGSVLFVLSLPVAAISKSVKSTADALVVRPAQVTFKRPLGDLDGLAD